MNLGCAVSSYLGTENFADYEQETYRKHQENAEHEIISRLNELLASVVFWSILKQWAGQCACRFLEYRDINIPITANDSWHQFCLRKIIAQKFSLSGENPLSGS